MTATELADRLEKWQMICRDDMADWQAAIAELRRIPELERRALTDEEVQLLKSLPTSFFDMHSADVLGALIDRISPPKPLLTWQDHGNGVWTARHGGATYSVSPLPDKAFWVGEWANRSIGKTGTADTTDAAKATAERWARGE